MIQLSAEVISNIKISNTLLFIAFCNLTSSSVGAYNCWISTTSGQNMIILTNVIYYINSPSDTLLFHTYHKTASSVGAYNCDWYNIRL
jgi:hypothetical protein